MHWRIALRARQAERARTLPPGILTIAPQLRHESMPAEVALLLPTNEGPKGLIDAVAEEPALGAGAMLGLFLASPFLNLEVEGRRLAQAGVEWIVNLPSIEQQDEEFTQQLADVGLDRARELDGLTQLRDQGFKIAVTVADGGGAAAAGAIAADSMIVLPRVGDFAAGFPSPRQRGAAAQAVAEAAAEAGWSGPILGLAEPSDAEHEALWPEALDGLVCRPAPA